MLDFATAMATPEGIGVRLIEIQELDWTASLAACLAYSLKFPIIQCKYVIFCILSIFYACSLLLQSH